MTISTSCNHIASLLCPERIVVDLDVGSKKRVFEQAGLLFENNQQLARSTVYDALFAREKLGSTGLGLGVAIPHGRIKGLKSATAAFFRLVSPIPFDAPDGVGVQLVFVLLVPQSANEQHLQLLSELAQMFSERRFRELLQAAPDSAALLELFSNWQSD
ncbi:MAG: PTS IIA-like nitrogen regulatory protein PtsN [Rhodocyclaceae bacterium]|nr:PTS IIA-like nitrogen regulatory protein PtsN [Rhodocyclaceae bacterium]MBK9624003.1 PTS IIA-like nitrogen regulatory protein PtsN [Rhodocyclaceae bacterium]MBL0076230.1 PTS IIA-like nitrogen regulatory protein PtsN [Rhodocyclaceae bacterium]MBP6109035.1 PTS IIA-like nitrogen regulatory protein PtsN [Rhodocyclaceae bacterium]MBP6279024.1 PTS IIA-like nitrogen regulatory protein PtsN [Rhodocyclaceae bacterium]